MKRFFSALAWFFTSSLALMAQSLPTVQGISPANALPGSTVTITGTNLSGPTAVSFGGVAATTYSYNATSLAITATVPTGARTGLVTVTTSGGTSSGFSYTIPLTITTQPYHTVVTAGTPQFFSVTAVGGAAGATYSYTWQRTSGGTPVTVGTNSSQLYVASPGAGDVGEYTVVVSDGTASVTSNPAALRLANAGVWTWRNPTTTGSDLWSVAYGAGRYVAVGRAGTIVTSSDGQTWSQTAQLVPNLLTYVTYLDSKFIAIGSAGILLTSADGLTWSKGNVGTASTLYGIARGASNWVVAGTGGVIFTSPDLAVWTRVPSSGFSSSITATLDKVITTSSGFMIVSLSGHVLKGDASGANWTVTQPAPGVSFFSLREKTVAGVTTTIAAGANSKIYYSTDSGTTWTAASMPAALTDAVDWESLLPTDNGWIVVGGNNSTTYRGYQMQSTDGITWTLNTTLPNGPQLYDVIFVGGQYVAVGIVGRISRSTDAVTWTQVGTSYTFPGDHYAGTTGAAGTLVAGRVDQVLLSTNHETGWAKVNLAQDTAAVPTTTRILGATQAAGTYVLVGGNDSTSAGKGFVFSSTLASGASASTWTRVEISGPAALNTIVYDPVSARYVAAGDGNQIYQAKNPAVLGGTDGWTAIAKPGSSTATVRASAVLNGSFVLTADSGVVFTSSDGLNWTLVNTGVSAALEAVAAGGVGTFVAGGNDGRSVLMRSTDNGATWNRVVVPFIGTIRGMTYADGRFRAVGGSTTMLMSADSGLTWTAETSQYANIFRVIVRTPKGYVAAGTNGVVATMAQPSINQSVATVTAQAGSALAAVVPVTAGGGVLPYVFSVSPTLPTGLKFDPATGEVSGTPSASAASAVYTVVATDQVGVSASSTFTLTVNPAAPSITGISPSNALPGSSVTISGTNLSGPTAVSFGGVAATAFSYDATSLAITATVPTGARSGPVTVTTAAGASSGFANTIPLTITAQPAHFVGAPEQAMAFSVTAQGGAAGTSYTYAWTRTNSGGTVTLGGTASTLYLPAVGASDEGDYAVTVSDGTSSVTSQAAALRISGADWTWRNPLPTGNDLWSVAFGGGKWLAVGTAGTFVSSQDNAASWSVIAQEPPSTFTRVVYAAGKFVAVGSNGNVITSTDLTSATHGNVGQAEALLGLAERSGLWVATGAAGSLYSSTDLVSWTRQTTAVKDSINAVTATADGFLGLSTGGAYLKGVVGTGGVITWTTGASGVSIPATGWAAFLDVKALASGGFVASGSDGLYTSANGTAWTKATMPTSQTGVDWQGVTVGAGGTLVAVGNRVTDSSSYLATSSDGGATWTSRTIPGGPMLLGVTYANNVYVAVGTLGHVITSTDAVTWTRAVPGGPTAFGDFLALATGPSGTVASGRVGSTYLSADHETGWTNVVITATGETVAQSSHRILGGTYAGGKYVLVGGNENSTTPIAFVFSSSTAASGSWTKAEVSGLGALNAVTAMTVNSAVRYVAAGAGGNVYYTGDPAGTWTAVAKPVSSVIRAAASGNGQFVLTGDNGVILRSSDGVTWTAPTTPVPGVSLVALATNGSGVWIAGGYDGRSVILRSSDNGATWTRINLPYTGSIRGISYHEGRFRTVGGTVTSLVSSDGGLSWGAQSSGYAGLFRAITRTSKGLVAVGSWGGIATLSQPALTQAAASVTAQAGAALTPVVPVTSAGGVPPYVFSVFPSLPAGLQFDAANGQVSGTPASSAFIPPFAGSDDFAVNSSAKWPASYRTLGSGTGNGSLAFNTTAGQLDFSKAAGEGSQFLRWDGDPQTAGYTRTTASYSTSWQAEVTATNGATVTGSEYASIGLQVASDGGWVALFVSRTASGVYARAESSSIASGSSPTATIASGTAVRLRFTWDAASRTLKGLYSTDAGASYTELVSLDSTSWVGTSGRGFFHELFANSSTAGALAAGVNYLDDFKVVATTPNTAVHTVYATDSVGLSANASFKLTVNPSAPVISSPATAGGAAGAPFIYQVVASNLPMSFSATGLASWMTFNGTTGVLGGTPTATGTTNVALTATNVGGTSAAFNLAVTIAAQAQTLTFNPPASKIYGDAAFAVTATADSGLPVTFTVISGPATISGDTVTLTGAGTVVLRASQSGDATRAPASVEKSILVGPRPLTVTAAPKSKVYGAADPALTYAVTSGSLVGADALSGMLMRAPGETVAGGPYAITQGTLAAGLNYTLTYVGANLTIAKAIPTVTVTPGSYTYNATAQGPALNAVNQGGSTGQVTLTFQGTNGTTYAASTTAPTNAGSYTVTAAVAADANYDAATSTATAFTIAPRALTVTAAPKSKVYGAADPALTYTVTTGSLAGTDALSGALTRAPGETVAGGPYAITQGTLGGGTNYTVTYVGANLTITKALPSVTVTPGTYTYNGTAQGPALNDVVRGGSTGQVTLTYVGANGTTYAASTTAPTNAGSYTVTAAVAADANYDAATSTATAFTIAPRPLTVTAAPKTKVYGAADPALTYAVTSGSLVGSDALSGALTRAPGETVAGGPYAITQGTVAAGTNYALTYVGANLTITKVLPTVTVTPGSYTYTATAQGPALNDVDRGNSTGQVTLTYQGANGTTYAASTMAPTNAGSYTVTAAVAADANYDAATSTATAFTIAPRPLSVTAVPKSKAFGAADPALTYTITSGSLAGADVLTGALARALGETVAGSPYAITQGTLAAGANYALTYVGANLTITKAIPTVTVTPGSYTYNATAQGPVLNDVSRGGSTGQVTLTYLGVNGTVYTASTTAPTNAGAYTVTAAVAADANYDAASSTATAFTIAPRPLTVTTVPKTKVYGAADPALTYTVTSGSLVGADALSGALTRAPGETVAGGPYAITQGTLSGGANYALTYVGANLTITKAIPTVTVTPGSYTYNATAQGPALNVVNQGGSTGQVTLTYQGATGTTYAASATAPTNAGSYTVTAAVAADANYDAATSTATAFTIAPRALTVTAAPKSKVYGASDPALTYTVTTGSLAGTDALSGALSRAPGETVAGGPYAITQGTLSGGANYALTYVGSNLTITKAAPTVTVTPGSYTYNATAQGPALNVVSQGGSTGQVTLTYQGATGTTYAANTTAPTNAGSYTVTAAVAADANYESATSAATAFTIAPRPLTVTAAPKTKVYGTTDPALTYTVTSGSLAGSDALSGALTRAPGETVVGGPYAITQGTVTAGANYALTYVGANLTITKAQPVISWSQPTPVTSGTVLTATQLNATAVPSGGTFAYTPALGSTVTAVGAVTLGVTYTPADTANYSNATAQQTITVTMPVPVITSAASVGGSVGTPLTYQTTATNSPTSYAATGLASWMSFNSTSGVLSGSPTTTGTTTVSLTASNAGGSSAAATLTVNVSAQGQVLTFNPPATKTLGDAPFAVSASSDSGLPVTISVASGPATISSGTVTLTGAGTVVLRATQAGDAQRAAATLDKSIFVGKGTPVVSWSQPASVPAGTVLGATQLNATANLSGGTFTYVPAAGTTLTSVGTTTLAVQYTPADTANYNSATAQQTITVTVPIPVISSAASATTTVGSAFSYQIVASNTPTAYAATGLPAGLSLNATTGVISGTPTTLGSANATLTATNAGGSSAPFTLAFTVQAGPAITTQPSANAFYVVGNPLTLSVAASGNPTPTYQWRKGGVNLSGKTGTTLSIASLTVADAGTYDVVVTNTAGSVNSLTVTFAVYVPPTITTQPVLQTVVAGGSATFSVVAAGDPVPALQWRRNGLNISGATASTLTLTNLTFDQAGTYSVYVSNAGGNVTSNGVALTVNPVAPVITSPLAVSGVRGLPLSYQATATSTGVTFSSSALPAGLTLNASSGQISGTPTALGTTPVSITATNITGTDSKTVSFVINPPPPVISSALAFGGRVGTVFSFQVTASNTPTSYAATGLPAGLSINAGTGLISGTPTAAGVFDVVLTATNAGGAATSSLQLTIEPPLNAPTFSGSTNLSAVQGTAFTFTPAFSGAPFTANFTAVGLPAGVTLSSPSLGTISGTPTVTGTFTVTITATNNGGTKSVDFTLVVNPAPSAPVVTSASTLVATVGSPVTFQLTSQGTPAASSYQAVGLPAKGLDLNSSTGLISGVPNQPGTLTLAVSATSAAVGTGQASALVITINPSPNAPVISSAPLATGRVGVAFSYQLQASNNPSGFLQTSGTLPAGLSFDSVSGAITGTPTEAGDKRVWFAGDSVTYGRGFAMEILFSIAPPATAPVISSNGTAAGQVGLPFQYQITATNSPTGFAATGLPEGLSVDATTGVISGLPLKAGTFSATLIATKGTETSDPKTLSLTIQPAPATPVITSPLTAIGRAGTSLSYSTTASESPTSFVATGLPAGLSLASATGIISGTPTVSGTFTVTLRAANGAGLGAAANLVFTLSAALNAPSITSAGSVTGKVGAVAGVSYQAQAAPGPISGYAITGKLPLGLTFNTSTGLLSGNPAEAGVFSVQLTASNDGGVGNPQTLVINIAPSDDVPVITSPTTVYGMVGTSFTYQISASSSPAFPSAPFPAPFLLDAVNLPPGLAVNPSTGVIQGTPTTSGTYTASLVGTNTAGTGQPRSLTMVIDPAPTAPVVNSPDVASAQAGVNFSYQITATEKPTGFEVLGAPFWMAFNSTTGAISGVPSSPGTLKVDLVAKNASGSSKPATLTLSIAAAANAPVVTSPRTASGTVQTAFAYQITALVPTDAPPVTSYFVSGLPTGLSFSAVTGAISGTPLASGTFSVTLVAKNTAGESLPVTLTLTIAPNITFNF